MINNFNSHSGSGSLPSHVKTEGLHCIKNNVILIN